MLAPNEGVSSPEEVPSEWVDAAAQIGAGKARRVVVIGAVDSGKSTLCRFLLSEARRAGRSPALLDCDVGQKTVDRPPA